MIVSAWTAFPVITTIEAMAAIANKNLTLRFIKKAPFHLCGVGRPFRA